MAAGRARDRRRDGRRRAAALSPSALGLVCIIVCSERYRSGRNGGASKASCRVSGTWVRIPPSPPPSSLSAQSMAVRVVVRLRAARFARRSRHESPPSPPTRQFLRVNSLSRNIASLLAFKTASTAHDRDRKPSRSDRLTWWFGRHAIRRQVANRVGTDDGVAALQDSRTVRRR